MQVNELFDGLLEQVPTLHGWPWQKFSDTLQVGPVHPVRHTQEKELADGIHRPLLAQGELEHVFIGVSQLKEVFILDNMILVSMN